MNDRYEEIKNKIVEVKKQLDKEDMVDVDDAIRIADLLKLNPADYRKIIQTYLYIKYAYVDRKSKPEAFKLAFPERCIDKHGEPISKSSIQTKYNRLENSRIFKMVYEVVALPLSIIYSFERIKVLEEALSISLDGSVSTRDRFQYMKLFLDETRKPDEAKNLEVNLNITQNNVSVQTLESKLDTIANTLTSGGFSADEIIEGVLLNEKQDKGSSESGETRSNN